MLEPGEAVEVEIVGRLVEEGDVEAGQHDGRERHLGLLSTGQGRRGLRGDVGRSPSSPTIAVESGVDVPTGQGVVKRSSARA